MRPALLCLLVSVACAAEPALLEDDFADKDLNAPVAWTAVRPGAAISVGKDGKSVLTVPGPACILAPPVAGGEGYTLRFRGSATYGAPIRCLFLYQDEDNYYSVGLGSQARGVFRKLKGQEVCLDADPLGKLTLPHAGGAKSVYKVYVQRSAGSLRIGLDRDGDEVDYDTWITESAAAVVAAFPVDRFGFACDKEKAAGSVAEVVVTAGRRSDVRVGVTWHVDAAQGDDARTPEQAQVAATPWKSIQKAAEAARSGDTVLVGPGIYRELVVPAGRGSAEAPITFRAADPTNRPVISGSAFVNPGAWEEVEITDFRGNRRKVAVSAIAAEPAMLYQNGKPLMLAQEPNQADAGDPYDLKFFMKVPPQRSKERLVDAGFLTQAGADYWKGATLLLWDSFPNAIGEFPVIGFDAQAHALQIKPLDSPAIGNDEKERQDTYALRGHLGLLDQPGEYHVDRSVTPARLYVLPYPDRPLSIIEGTARPHGFNFSQGREHLVVDGFVIRDCASHGVTFGGRDANHITIRNCDLVGNMSCGVSGRFVNDITIERCLMRDNRDNGASFGNCRQIQLLACEITANGDNGIWFGGGQPGHWNSQGILVRGCHIHHASARRRHPDNYQMHQCRDVVLENNVFVQEGDQNMWCQYSDEFTLRNNIFIGGALGINSAIHSRVVHNVFWRSQLRYSRHLDNHPQNKDYYKPQAALLRNNVFVDSSIDWPDARLVDRFKAFTVDHNYYCIGNANSRSAWEWNGRVLSPKADGLIVADPELPAAGGVMQATATLTWSHPARLLLLYRDPDNHYWLGLGNKPGLWRRQDGVETCLDPDAKSLLRLPHQGGASATFRIATSVGDGGLTFTITRSGVEAPIVVVDADAAARARFTAGRFGVQNPGKQEGRCSLAEIRLEGGGTVWSDDFNDADPAKAARPDEPTWTVVQGAVEVRSRGGNGVGYGAGSIIATDAKGLAAVFCALPDEHGAGFDFHSVPGSPLIDAGVDAGVAVDLEGKPRPQGAAVDIGPYEVAR